MQPWIELLAQQDAEPNQLLLLLATWGPVVLIVGIIVLAIRKGGSAQVDNIKRYHDHLDKRETSYDEIIAQLRELNQTLKERDVHL